MLYQEKPDLKNLPTNKQLVRSSIIAVATAIVLAVAVVLPAEYAFDPTGAGRVLGLTEMGEIKQELAREAEQDHQSEIIDEATIELVGRMFSYLIGTAEAHAANAWDDEFKFELQPGDTHELKLTMRKGDYAEYNMIVEGGRVNFDMHAHGGGESITYEKGRGSTGSSGVLLAAFDGDHGWFWRNRDNAALTVTLQLRGAYSEIKQ